MKKTIYLYLFIIHFGQLSYAQIQDTSKWFDFWVGEWEVSWQEGNNAIGTGINRITATLDGKVIQEHFQIKTGQSKGFKGTSISVFDPRTKIWHQAWADNQGGYYDFVGEMQGADRIFKTAMVEKDGVKYLSRMVFKNITPNAFVWDWESSQDGGQTWKLNWQIHYKRRSALRSIIKQFPNVRDFTVSPEGNEAYFTAQSHGEDNATIIKITGNEGKWIKSEIASFSGRFEDLEPFLSPNGLRLYFVSNRPLDQNNDKTKDYDIWYVERESKTAPWSKPINLGMTINSAADEFYPSVASNGNLYFTCNARTTKGKDDIFFSKWTGKEYRTPISLSDSINSSGYEYNAFVAPDESFLIFGAYKRKDGFGSGDLYISYRLEDNSWSQAKNLGANINSPRMDYCPFVDTKNKMLYFTSKKSDPREKKPLGDLHELLLEFNRYSNGQSRVYGVPWVDITSK